MLRDCLALFVAFAVALFGMDPQMSAQEQYPPQQQMPAPGADANAPGPDGGQAPPYAGQQQPPYVGQQQPPYTGQQQQPPYAGQQQPPYTGQPQQGQGGDMGGFDPAAAQQHGVARLSVVEGEVNVKRGDNGELVAAAANTPVVASDQVQTGPAARAELELDYSNIVRLGPNTCVGFATLQSSRFQLQLGAGTVIYRVVQSSPASAEIDTPSVGVRPTAQGVYRISVTPDGVTQIAVRLGSAEVYSPRGTEQLSAGQTMAVRGDPSNPEFLSGASVDQDQFEDWSIGRDRQIQQSQAYQHVSPNISGAEDLDAYGSWVPSQYGQVWAPRSPAPDWSPYSDGHWAYIDNYYGWTWIGNEPWGWAPYHYGRWFWNGGYGWSWWPGAPGGPAYWSPACVGFFGFGAGLAAGILAGIGWVALAPFELFHPWWGHGWGFGGRFGYGGFGGFRGNIAGMYRNAGFRGGALMASAGQFGSHFGRFPAATREQLAGASAFRGGALPIRPTQASYHFANRQAVPNARLSSVSNRSFFHGSTAAAGGLASRGFQNGAGSRTAASGGYTSANRTAGAGGFNGQRGATPNVASRAAAGSSGQQSSGGWQRFGASGSTYRQGFSSTGSSQQGGWHSFGRPEANGRSATGGSSAYSGSAYAGGRSNYGTSGYAGNARSQTSQSYGGGAYRSQPQTGYSQSRGAQQSYGARQSYGNYGGSQQQYHSAPQSSGRSYGGGATPHYSAPSGGSYRGGNSGSGGHSYGGGSSSHSSGGGGGGHSSGGGGGGHSGGGHSGGGGGHRR